jgi:hypothetical protein
LLQMQQINPTSIDPLVIPHRSWRSWKTVREEPERPLGGIVKKRDIFLRTKYFIVVEDYNPRIHALYFCPQLFRHESGKLVPLEGEGIGQLIARAVEASAIEPRPWYKPMEKLPQERLINSACCANTTRSWSKCLREILCPPAASSFWPGLATKPKHLDPARWLRGAPWILNQRTRAM